MIRERVQRESEITKQAVLKRIVYGYTKFTIEYHSSGTHKR